MKVTGISVSGTCVYIPPYLGQGQDSKFSKRKSRELVGQRASTYWHRFDYIMLTSQSDQAKQYVAGVIVLFLKIAMYQI